MKKIISLSVAIVMLVAVLLPTNVFALTNSTDVKLNKNFSDFTQANTPVLGGVDANSVLSIGAAYKFYGGGSVAEFAPETGVFGKAADDTSVKITRNSSSGNARMYGGGKLQANGGLGAGNAIVINWNWAFDDNAGERTATAEFYKGTSTSYVDIKKFYAIGSTETSTILSVSPNGVTKLFNQVVANAPVAQNDKWYNYEVRITNGSSADATYSKASLYVDGILVGTTDINCAESSYQLNGLGWFYFDAPVGVTYVDDLQIGFFRNDAANDMYTEMQQTFELTSKSDAYVTDNVHIDLKNDMTVQEFLDDVSYNGRTSSATGITEVKVLKADWSEADVSETIEDGWYARVKAEGDWNSSLGRNVYRYYYRKFAPVSYYASDYDCNISTTSRENVAIPDLSFKFGQYWENTTNIAGIESAPGLAGGQAAYAYANAREAANSYLMFRYHSGKKTLPDKYVIELSLLRASNYAEFPGIKMVADGQSIVYMDENSLQVGRSGQSTFVEIVSKPGAMTRKWAHIAIEVEGVSAKVYVNGVYSGLEFNLDNHNIFHDANGLTVSPATAIANGITGGIYVDNFKVYSGAYTPAKFEVVSADYNTEANEIVTVAGNVSVDEFKAATSAVAVYTYSNRNFNSEVTEGNIADGQVAVFKDTKGKVRYFDIELLPVISEVVFTQDGGTIKAVVTVETRNEKHVIASSVLVLAKKTANGDELIGADYDAKSDMAEVGSYNFEAELPYADGDNIIAYFWDEDLRPFSNSKAVYTK